LYDKSIVTMQGAKIIATNAKAIIQSFIAILHGEAVRPRRTGSCAFQSTWGDSSAVQEPTSAFCAVRHYTGGVTVPQAAKFTRRTEVTSTIQTSGSARLA
jgi:hypothetical protein